MRILELHMKLKKYDSLGVFAHGYQAVQYIDISTDEVSGYFLVKSKSRSIDVDIRSRTYTTNKYKVRRPRDSKITMASITVIGTYSRTVVNCFF